MFGALYGRVVLPLQYAPEEERYADGGSSCSKGRSDMPTMHGTPGSYIYRCMSALDERTYSTVWAIGHERVSQRRAEMGLGTILLQPES